MKKFEKRWCRVTVQQQR